MAKPRSPVPQLPSQLSDKLDGLDPEDSITVLRRSGNRQYDELETFAAAPTTQMRIRDVATRVADSVDADGDGYFAVEATDAEDDDATKLERWSWYAFRADAGATVSDGGDAPPMTSQDWLLQRTTDALARFITFFPTMAESANSMMVQNREQAQALIEMMNDHMAAQQELMIGIAQEERKAAREAEAFKLGHRWMDTMVKDRDKVREVQQNLCARLEPGDFDKLRAHEAGKAVLGAESISELRDAARKLVDAIKAGELTLEASSLSRVVPWMTKLAQAPTEARNEDAKPKGEEPKDEEPKKVEPKDEDEDEDLLAE